MHIKWCQLDFQSSFTLEWLLPAFLPTKTTVGFVVVVVVILFFLLVEFAVISGYASEETKLKTAWEKVFPLK